MGRRGSGRGFDPASSENPPSSSPVRLCHRPAQRMSRQLPRHAAPVTLPQPEDSCTRAKPLVFWRKATQMRRKHGAGSLRSSALESCLQKGQTQPSPKRSSPAASRAAAQPSPPAPRAKLRRDRKHLAPQGSFPPPLAPRGRRSSAAGPARRRSGSRGSRPQVTEGRRRRREISG